MKILILLDDFPPVTYTGASIVAYNLAQGLLKKGHDIFVITATQDKDKAEEEEYNGLKIFRIYTNYHEHWQAYSSLYNPQIIPKIEKIIKKIKPNICHFHHIHRCLSYYCFKIAKKYCPAVFLTAHDTMLFNYGKLFEFIDLNNLSIPKTFNYRITSWQQIKRYKKRYNPLRNIIIKHYLKHIDKIFAVSYALKDALNQNNIKNVEVIHNGMDIEKWQMEKRGIEEFQHKYNLKDKKVVLFGGRLSVLKGGNKIIKAMELVSEEISNAVLLVIGEKNVYAQKMQELAKEKNVNLILAGWINHHELKFAYFCSNIVVTPSFCLDTFNMINTEGMICRKPVVGTCFGGTPEIVLDNKTGYIVNPLNIELMAKKIIDLLKNPQKAKQFGEAGYQRVKNNFSLKQQVEQTLDWYEKFL